MNDLTGLAGRREADERVEAVNKAANRPLYAKRVKIHPRDVSGAFRRAKWTILIVLLGIYYVAPWLRWERGPNSPNQAILVDFPSRKFCFFFIEIWPQEIYYLTGILILMAVGLFLFTSTFGRVWCGFGCPQTVWTDLYIWVERLIEGDRAARMRLDVAAWTPSKSAKRVLKHAVWLVIAMLTGGAWVFYFADAPTLLREFVTFDAPAAAWITVAFLTTSTYVLAGFAREQVCTYMCPYARFQAAMLDEHSIIVTYHADRGEPRGKYRKGDTFAGRGDCIDCFACVAVCPTGIDIRDGQQLECINCGLCVDACNEVMDRIGRPRGLIGLDTLTNVEARRTGLPSQIRVFRTRTFVYLGIMATVGLVMLFTLITRATLDVNVLRDRNPLYVQLADGSIRNTYTFHVLNKRHEARRLVLRLEGVPQATFSVLGQADDPRLAVEPDSVATYRIFVQMPRAAVTSESIDVGFMVQAEQDGEIARYRSVFRGPGR